MKKQRIQFIILLVLLLVCIGGYFVIKNAQFETEEETEGTEEVVVTELDASKVTGLSGTGRFAYSFEKDADTWIETGMPDADIDESLVDSIVSDFCALTTTEKVVENPDDLSAYELDEPYEVLTLTMEDGSQTVLNIGTSNSLLAKFYVQVEGDSNVYLINYSTVSAVLKDAETFVAEEETETTAE